MLIIFCNIEKNSCILQRPREIYELYINIQVLRPNLRNLSRSSNMRRGSNMVGSTWNCIQCFEILAGAQLEPVFGQLRRRPLALNLETHFYFYVALDIYILKYNAMVSSFNCQIFNRFLRNSMQTLDCINLKKNKIKQI